MRALAGRLGVVPMALYKHVRDKGDLVSGMIDAVVAEYPRPAPGLPWREAVRERVLGARDALLAHPWLRSAIEASPSPTATVLAYQDALVADFIDGGVPVDLTHYAMHALGHRIWGFNPEAFAAAGRPAAALTAEEQESAAAAFPHIAAIAMDAASRNPTAACDEQFEFEFTLDLLLDAFERLNSAGWESRAAAR
jgi:AcrR family transcriptional regulator